jgi:hypothetical protein
VNAPNLDPCNDGNACTTVDTCSGGACVGGPPPDCDDDNICTDDGCSPASGCTNPPNTDPCDDGNACTVGDTCSAGACESGGPLDCDDDNVCTADTCNLIDGCENQPIPDCADTDLDGRRDKEDECTTLEWSSNPSYPPDQHPNKFRLSLKKLSTPGYQGIKAKGFFNPPDSALQTFEVDPVGNGVHVQIEDEGGMLYELSLPGGLLPGTGCDTKDGWKMRSGRSKTTWKYTNKSGGLPPGCYAGSAKGVTQILIKDLRSTSKGAFQIKVKVKDTTLAGTPVTPVRRLQFDLAFSAQPSPGTASLEAIAGLCAEGLFAGNPVRPKTPKPFCKVKFKTGGLHGINCKGL